MNHTKGPWKVEHTFGEMIIRDSEDYPIATMTGEDSDNEARANAYLVATAPILFEENERLKEERTKLITQLDICRASLKDCVLRSKEVRK